MAQVVQAIKDLPGASIREYADKTGINRGSIERNIVKLKAQSFVKDKLGGGYAITPKGIKALSDEV
jgi:DNA-binding transcriptional regulator YhcF (GntR family)